jgi:hypothetical protein
MTALFYPTTIAKAQLVSLVHGLADPADLGLDVLTFGEPPAPLDRELAVPLLGGMDEIEVTEARLRLRARARTQDITAWSTVMTTGPADRGVVLALQAPARLRKVVIDAPAFPDGKPLEHLHVVVRPATPKAGGGFTFGPPSFAAPPFALPSPMYGPILGGLTVTDLAGGRQRLELPATAGTAWLLQHATGTDAASLAPVRFTTVVRTVTIDAVPSDVEVVLAADGEEDEVVLWSHPGALLPDIGEQDISFAPLAQRHLSARLASAGAAPTLPVSLSVRSATTGDLIVAQSALSARYRVKPLAAEPLTLALPGGWSDLALRAPAGLRALAGTLQAGVRHLGRELNGGSPDPPRALPDAGLRADANRWAAVAVAVEGTAPLVSAQVLLAVPAATEAVVELRAGGAGAPGPALAAPVVAQLEPGPPAWIEFELATPLAAPGEVWLVVRATRGSVRWFAGGDAGDASRISLDRGATWGAPEPSLTPAGAPLALLYHRLDGELPLPQVHLELAGAQVSADLLAGAARTGPASFTLTSLAVPDPVLAALRAAPGSPGERFETTLTLFSRAVAELTLSGAALTYDPYGHG